MVFKDGIKCCQQRLRTGKEILRQKENLKKN
jgi:hypothetical protein